jgi:Mg2+ and Co2+ transporter CorA
MASHLVTVEGEQLEPTPELVRRLLTDSRRFWLDLTGPDEDVHAYLRDTFQFHPLATEDAEHFGQRPKLDLYDDFVLLVMYGVSAAGQLVEVHCFTTSAFSSRCIAIPARISLRSQSGGTCARSRTRTTSCCCTACSIS